MSTATNEEKKRRGTSIPLLIVLIILGIVGYFYGQQIMTYAFYLQESMIANSGKNAVDMRTVTPDTLGDPNARPRVDGPIPGDEEPGASGPSNAADAATTDSSDPPSAEGVVK